LDWPLRKTIIVIRAIMENRTVRIAMSLKTMSVCTNEFRRYPAPGSVKFKNKRIRI
jgi:hypothetical protein